MAEAVKRAFKYRFYPTPEQADQLNRTFGCVRLVYNRALDARTRAWTVNQQRTTYVQTSAMLTQWKHTDDLAFRWRDGQLTLAKMDAPLAIVWSRPLPDRVEPATVTVSRDAAGRWFVSLLVEDLTVQPLPPVDRAIGVDAGITSLLTLSTGEKVTNPKHEHADRRKLAKAQRELSRKDKGSANRAKARVKVARVHARIADRRWDHLHKLTTRLVRENQTVVIEDLSVRNMVRNHRLARAISDAAWSDLRAMLEYKAVWYARAVIAVDRWFPSSKTCSTCERINPTMPLGVRVWTCPGCGATHDRDVNAAKNILAAGLAER
jgi:putative transposase